METPKQQFSTAEPNVTPAAVNFEDREDAAREFGRGAVAAMEQFLGLSLMAARRGVPDPSHEWDHEYKEFEAGRTFGAFIWSDSLFNLARELPDSPKGADFGRLPPAWHGERYFQLESWVFAVPRNARDPDMSFEFIKRWTEDGVMQRLWSAAS